MRRRFDSAQIAMKAQEDLLRDLLRQAAVAQKPPGNAIDHGLMPPHQFAEVQPDLFRRYQAAHCLSMSNARLLTTSVWRKSLLVTLMATLRLMKNSARTSNSPPK